MRKNRPFLAMALAVAMSVMTAIPVLAAETITDTADSFEAVVSEFEASGVGENNVESVMPRSTSYVMVGNSYTTVAYNPNGINGDLYLSVTGTVDFDGASYQLNVLMYDSNNSVVWRGDNVAGWPGTSCTLSCGANVTRVDLQIAPRYFWVSPNTFEVKVTY